MSYNHTRVDHIEKKTKSILQVLLDKISTVNESDPPLMRVDTIPVTPELARFCAEIRKVNRHVKFGLSHRIKHSMDGMFRELHVYMEGHTYAMLKIGYGDYSVKRSGGDKYMVSARMIQNDKFRVTNDQYHMAMAETLDRAMRSVKKFMRPYSPVECAQMSFDEIRQRFTSVGNVVSGELNEAKYNVLNSNHIRAELFHMLDVGYEFLAEEFREQIVKWREKHIADREARNRALHVYYVNVRIHREEMLCDVIEVLDANKRSSLGIDIPVTTYKMEDLPEGVAGSLAALSMVADDHYVDGVGLRVDSTTFWVQR